MPLQKLTEEEKSLYKRNVEYFVSKLQDHENSGDFESPNVELEIDPKLKVKHIKIKGLSKELEAEIKLAFEEALSQLMYNFESHTNKCSYYYLPYLDDLEITLADYVEYVLKNN